MGPLGLASGSEDVCPGKDGWDPISGLFTFPLSPLDPRFDIPGVRVLQGMKGQGCSSEGRSLRFNGTFSARQGDCKTQLI